MSGNGWPQVALGEVLTRNEAVVPINPTEQYKEVTIRLWGKGVVLRRMAVGSEIAAERRLVVRANHFILSRIDARNGAMGLVPEELDGAVVSNDFPSYEANSSAILPEFLGWLSKTRSFVDVCRTASEGTTNRVRLQESKFFKMEIPLPPMSEQRRIVAKIERLAGKVDEARGLRLQAELGGNGLYGSYAFDLFTRQLHGKVPTIPLGEIADIVSGVTLGRQITGQLLELPYLRVANVQDGFLDLGTIKQVFIRVDETEKWKLQSGDLLLTEGGDWDKLGRGTVWQNEIPNCIHQNHIFRLRFNLREFEPRYVLTLTRSPYGKEYFQAASKQTTNLASINQRQLKAFPVYRLPLAEQWRIVAYLDGLQAKVDELKRLQAETAAELDALLPAVLDRAFKGEL